MFRNRPAQLQSLMKVFLHITLKDYIYLTLECSYILPGSFFLSQTQFIEHNLLFRKFNFVIQDGRIQL